MITDSGLRNAMDSGLITQSADGEITFHFERLPTVESQRYAQAWQTWEDAGKPVGRGTGAQHPLFNAVVHASVNAGLYCPYEVAELLGAKVEDVYHPSLASDTFSRTAIDALIDSGWGNADIRDLSERNGWPVSTGRIATRRNRLQSRIPEPARSTL